MDIRVMKKHALLIIAAIAALLTVSSCFKAKEKNYSFGFTIESNIPSTEESKERFEQITAVINAVPFFSTTPSYFGTYLDACNAAANDFFKYAKTLDGEKIASLLKEGEEVYLCMTSSDTGEYIGYMYWFYGMEMESQQ